MYAFIKTIFVYFNVIILNIMYFLLCTVIYYMFIENLIVHEAKSWYPLLIIVQLKI